MESDEHEDVRRRMEKPAGTPTVEEREKSKKLLLVARIMLFGGVILSGTGLFVWEFTPISFQWVLVICVSVGTALIIMCGLLVMLISKKLGVVIHPRRSS